MSAPGSRRHSRRALVVVGYACLTFSLAQMMLFPALPALIDGLDTNANDVALALAAYFLAAAVATPILGRLGDMFGKRRMLVVSMTAFTAGALISAVSTELWMVIVGRAIQGIGGGVLPLSFSMARELVPPRQVARAVGLLAAMLSLGTAVGMIVGGAIVDHLSWQWIFWATAAMGAVATLAVRILTPESPTKSGGRVDIRGAIVLSVGLTLPLFAISRAAVWGWADLRTLTLIAFGIVVLAGWVKLELHTEQPLANVASLRSAPVLLTNLATVPPGFASQAMIVTVALLAQAPTSTGSGFGLGATGAGLILAPGALLAAAAGPVSSALGARAGNKIPLAFGGVVGTAALVLLGIDHGGEVEVVILVALAFGSFGLAIAALPNLIIDAVPPSSTGESLSFNMVMMRASNSLGVQVASSIVAASAVAGVLPTNRGFEIAFFVAAAVWFVGVIVALAIPRVERRDHRAVRSETAGEAQVATL